MTDPTQAKLIKYMELLGRQAEIKKKLGETGKELQEIGEALMSGPEWVKFSGNVPPRPFDGAEQFNPKSLQSFDSIRDLVDELRKIYYEIEIAHNQLASYGPIITEPPKLPPNPFE